MEVGSEGVEVTKIGTHCDFGDTLRVSPTQRYRLRGVLTHAGPYRFGHCTACVSNSEGQWYLCDDERIRSVSFQYVEGRQAYMLFYESVL